MKPWDLASKKLMRVKFPQWRLNKGDILSVRCQSKWRNCEQKEKKKVLLDRYWWNTRISPFTKKSYLHIFIFHLWGYRCHHSYYNITSQLQESLACSQFFSNFIHKMAFFRFAFAAIKFFLFFIRILTFWNRKYILYHCIYFSFITLYLSFITFLWQAFCNRWPL